jgi:hypothetical protein
LFLGFCGQELLNFVELRIDPGAAAERMGGLVSKLDTRLQQHLVDLRYALSQPSFITDEDTFLKRIRQGDLVACQFPRTITDRKGTFAKPAGW